MQKKKKTDEDSLTIAVEERDGIPSIAASGAHGAPSPDGSTVVLHLYTEYPTLPSLLQVPMKGERAVMNAAVPVRRSAITREIQGTVVMSPEAAVRVGAFLVRIGRDGIERRKEVGLEVDIQPKDDE